MSDMPVPETRSPILVNALGVPTKHVYAYTEPALAEDGEPIYVHYFKCTKTDAIRVYGNWVA